MSIGFVLEFEHFSVPNCTALNFLARIKFF